MRCPECGSKNVIKKGKRKTRYGIKQRYLCKDCNRRFTDNAIRHKIYSPRVIYNAINYYDMGDNIREVSKRINKTFKIKTSKSIVHTWIHEFQDLCPISTVRDSFSEYESVAFTKSFEHENLDYEFMYHQYKLDNLARDKFPGLFRYVKRFEKGCPDVFFEVGERCSKPIFEVKVTAKKKTNLACRMAGFAVQAAKNNYERHKMVETFMLINDKATVACEIPVWYWEKNVDNGVTGHIDVLQVRNDKVYILDYKPGAGKDKKAAGQLYHYALALSFRTRIPLKQFRCAWFDQEYYFEYDPTKADVKPIETNILSNKKKRGY